MKLGWRASGPKPNLYDTPLCQLRPDTNPSLVENFEEWWGLTLKDAQFLPKQLSTLSRSPTNVGDRAWYCSGNQLSTLYSNENSKFFNPYQPYFLLIWVKFALLPPIGRHSSSVWVPFASHRWLFCYMRNSKIPSPNPTTF